MLDKPQVQIGGLRKVLSRSTDIDINFVTSIRSSKQCMPDKPQVQIGKLRKVISQTGIRILTYKHKGKFFQMCSLIKNTVRWLLLYRLPKAHPSHIPDVHSVFLADSAKLGVLRIESVSTTCSIWNCLQSDCHCTGSPYIIIQIHFNQRVWTCVDSVYFSLGAAKDDL